MDKATYEALGIAQTDDPASMLNINDPSFKQSSNDPYTLPLEVTTRADGAPQGLVTGSEMPDCEAFPGASHTVWVYVPAQYTATTPANLMVWFDGGGFAGYRRESYPNSRCATHIVDRSLDNEPITAL